MSESESETQEGVEIHADQIVLIDVMSYLKDKLHVTDDLFDWIKELKSNASNYVDSIWSDQSNFLECLRKISAATNKKDKEIFVLKIVPECIYLIAEMNKRLNDDKETRDRLENKNCDLHETVNKLKDESERMIMELKVCAREKDQLQDEIAQLSKLNKELNKKLARMKCEHEKFADELRQVETDVRRVKNPSLEKFPLKALSYNSLIRLEDRSLKSENEQSEYESETKSHDEKRAKPLTQEYFKSYHSSQPQPIKKSHKVHELTKIINFLKNSVGIYDLKASSKIINHLNVFEETLEILGINSDAQKIELIPWVFESKHIYFFQSLKESGIRNWSKIVSEVKSEFGPHRTNLAAKRAILTLKCRPNQSPREFLSVFKNVYSLAERNPYFENPEFIQLFYDALPNKIKVILARDYDPRNGLDWVLKESMTLFTVFEYSEETQGKRVKNSPEEIAETHVKMGDIKFESHKKSYAEILRDSIPQREKSKPDQERGFAKESSGSKFQSRKQWVPRSQWVKSRENVPRQEATRGKTESDASDNAQASSPRTNRKRRYNVRQRISQM
uniref:Retrotransposon gag domain-containing protein n=1 Tax=Leptobrachium leishanense TaxID=445787 RepID=A0A8C5WI19_9ANUR